MTERIPYYVVKNGNGFWQPNSRMRQLGFQPVPCGPDDDRGRSVARTWNQRWQDARSMARPKPPVLGDKGGYVYFLRTGDRVKIGFSRNPFTRAGEMKTGISTRVLTMAAVRGRKADETYLHRRLAAFRQAGEWFVASAMVLKIMNRTLAFGSVDTSVEGDEKRTAAAFLSEQENFECRNAPPTLTSHNAKSIG